jgi:hypothetical protein
LPQRLGAVSIRYSRALVIRHKLKWVRQRTDRRIRLLYRRSLAAEGVAVSLDTATDSDTALMAFGGMKSAAGIASFEFVALTRSMPVKKIYVRDPRQSWYHRGMPSQGNTLESVGEVLREIVQQNRVKRLVTVGASAGGYAALVFGALLEADEVLAFGPQTVLDRATLDAMGDHRWDDLLQPLHEKGAIEPRWADLREALPRALAPRTRCKVFFDITTDDRQHAERLAGIDGVRMFRFGRGGHVLARALRDCGALDPLLRRALRVPAADGGEAPQAEEAPPQELRFRTYG